MKSRTSLAWALAFGAACLVSGASEAGKREDFQAACKIARQTESCETIPYSDLLSDCKSQGSYVHEWCDGGRGPVSCERNLTGQLKTNLVNAERTLSDLRDQKYRVESAKSSASDDTEKSRLDQEIRALDDKIREADNAVSKARVDLDQRRRTVEDTIYNIEKCIDYRKAIANVFSYALDRMRTDFDRARSDPANAEVDALDAECLRDSFEKSKRGHEIQITDRENARGTCRDERP